MVMKPTMKVMVPAIIPVPRSMRRCLIPLARATANAATITVIRQMPDMTNPSLENFLVVTFALSCPDSKCEFDPSVDLFCGRAARQRGVRKVHCRRIKTDQLYAFHRPSFEPVNSVGARLA